MRKMVVYIVSSFLALLINIVLAPFFIIKKSLGFKGVKYDAKRRR